jgi:uncharacterized membrane protein
MRPTARIRSMWYNITASLWFVPTLMAFASIVAAVVFVSLDRVLDLHDTSDEAWWLIQSSAGSARQILTTIASTTATVLGVVFSITIIALQLASTQYSPRVLREFMRDRGSQVVMGTFISTFTYAILVARTVRDADEELHFVPIISLNVGILLSLATIAALIYFINHIAESIQVANLVATLGRATVPLVDAGFPGRCGRAVLEPPALDEFRCSSVLAPRSGYLQVIEADHMLEVATRNDMVIEMNATIGDFVAEGAAIARVYGTTALDDRILNDVQENISIGRRRTLQQDAAYGIRQIVDIAVKAMSPSINDPTTALICVDHLGVILRRLATRSDTVPYRADATGRLRLVVQGLTFGSALSQVFTPLRVYARKDPDVVLRLLTVLRRVAEEAPEESRRELLWREAEMLARAADRELEGEFEREMVNERLRALGIELRREPASILLRGASLQHRA